MSDHCRVFTPKEYVNTMLDIAGYTDNLFGKTVLENSCGEGEILLEIIRRYVIDCRKQGLNNHAIRAGILRDIKAYEIDAKCIARCEETIKLLSTELQIKGIRCNIINEDYLASEEECYDYIIGNPPYITHHDMPPNVRTQLKNKYKSCAAGRFDYYYAFLEKSWLSLKSSGTLVYLIPFSVFRNKYAQCLRDTIKNDVVSVIDYSGVKVFDGVMVTAAIIHIIKDSNNKTLDYIQTSAKKCIRVHKNRLSGKWFFNTTSSGKRFGDYFTVKNSVATLFNEAFLITKYDEDQEYIVVKGNYIEKGIIRDAVSVKSCKKNKESDKIIFPYKSFDGGYERITEERLYELYPRAMNYLGRYEKELSSRKSSKGTAWFEYGRTQALKDLHGNKLIISAVITTRVKTYYVKADAVPYAGFFIKVKQGSDYDLAYAKHVLEAPEFFEYIKKTGTPTTTMSYRITVNEIEDYVFNEQDIC